ncbi:endonuclease/exonuclease/phosphatase family protein [Planotetraspora sp. A-T 1434]|uniref:endonuclease/exonuclease/phosphatase family protein n=1 Tax=Planotetraspora sp. A-T 1434 TaxID=2979219 RepID=UPI0021C0B87B|nr:endonuclease/exonuclease/phosphatase family protein [Planotetraspora sp. A-T 1434]MCT9932530.1 endonuclease/exonuclease/phosphatase family protein [Planotetraspora sp. A-T 1434]
MTKVDVGGVVAAPRRRRRRVPAALAWVAVTPFVVWAVARLAGLDRWPVIVELMTGTPYVAAASLGAVLIAVASRNRAAIAVAAVTSVLMACVVLPRALGSTPTPTGPTLKILTSNLLFGSGDAQTVVDLVRRLGPDVLTTQELTPAEVEDLKAAGLGTLLPYEHLEAGEGPSGSGIFSRYPLTELPDFAPSGGHNMPSARLTLPTGRVVEIVDVHTLAPLGPDVATWQADLKSLPSPATGVIRILAGDFNASLDHSALREVLARGYVDAADATGTGLNTTWPANRRLPPLITIDHVLYDQRASALNTSVHAVPRTDHRALFAELRLP